MGVARYLIFISLFSLIFYHILPVFSILPQERGAHKEVKHMDNNKKPSEPVEEERWVKMEKEIKRLKRTTSLLVVSLLLQSIAVFQNVLRINRLSDTIALIISFDELVYKHLNSLNDSFLRILNNFEVLLGSLSKFL